MIALNLLLAVLGAPAVVILVLRVATWSVHQHAAAAARDIQRIEADKAARRAREVTR